MTPVSPLDCVPARVSVHGGHSGEFCVHATDTLEEIVRAYCDQGFAWVGITEHMPPPDDRRRYPDDIEAGLTAADLQKRFRDYMAAARALQRRYADAITLYVGFETEGYSGYASMVRGLVSTYQPDYIVGSLHHIDDMPIDYSPEGYAAVARHCGGLDQLYCRYFDRQLELIDTLRPAVVGHMDLIRIFDPDYLVRLEKPDIRRRIRRNLRRIAELGLILDLNMRALSKGADEPYVSAAILREALQMGIAVVPGDDSHGVASAGQYIDRGIELLVAAGSDGRWPTPDQRPAAVSG